VTSQIDRVGYRLEGAPIRAATHDIFSEGIAYGAIQIPENGQPIVMMKDRPTVGGYPKIGTILPEDVWRLAQCKPGQMLRFEKV
jgi:allophanate hydrolase subunit 2